MRLVEQHGIYASTEWLAELAGVHRTTAERWKRSQRLPKPISTLMRVMLDGELELVHSDWSGWRLDRRTGVLYTPDGWPCRPSDILAIRYRLAQVRALERELAAARARLRDVENAGFFGRFFKRA